MAEPLVPIDATERLNSLLSQDGEPTTKVAAFRTPAGRHLAINLDQKRTRLWLEAAPPAIDGISIHERYQSNEPRTHHLDAGRGSRLAKGHPVVVVNVDSLAALEALVAWYTDTPVQSKSAGEPLCLIGTWKGFTEQNFERVAKFIADHGAWASWWSFRIKDEARPLLKLPFWLYVNRGSNSIVARYLVSEVTSEAHAIVSPWPAQTEPHLVGQTSDGDGPSSACNTWLRVTKIERLLVPLTKDDFTPAPGLSQESSLLNQMTFGYAFPKKPITATPIQKKTPMLIPNSSLNTILYGPPGTSKTFETIDHALAIVDPGFALENASSRAALKERFDTLRALGRIEFVTFHQSYSYEDFVEGIRASTEDGQIRYEVEDGIFKRLCTRAVATEADDKFRSALDEFKQSIFDESVELKTKTGKTFSLTWRGGKTLRLRPHSSKEDADYPVSTEHVERLYRGESEEGLYNISYVRAVLAHVVEKWKVPAFKTASSRQPYVLIIDEINRGNIASIFGELITLIEPSKRAGASEAISTILPYSKSPTPFSVPDNLYIIGTMNTADRSLARVDTALRRRFDFVPMYPQPTKLDGVLVEGIDLGALLRRINDRIELLYDRDHLIGHAFFMDMKEDPAKRTLPELGRIFRNKVLPLLEEYFFEDWQKIRLVLADNQKPLKQHQFVLEDDVVGSGSLFGEASPCAHDVRRYRRNDDALMQVESYLQVYAG